MFQAVFTWAVVPADAIDAGFANLGNAVRATMPDGVLRSLIADGVIAGVGAVVVFLPQILILFFFILLLEASGRSEEHTSELQSLMRISYAVFCLKKKNSSSSFFIA